MDRSISFAYETAKFVITKDNKEYAEQNGENQAIKLIPVSCNTYNTLGYDREDLEEKKKEHKSRMVKRAYC